MIPIIFSTEMVQAILDGRKTQMRRVATSLECFDLQTCVGKHRYRTCPTICKIRPRYKVGDVLWVKEAWRFTGWPSMDQNDYWIQFKDGKDKRLDVDDDEYFDEDNHYRIECEYDLESAGWPSNEDGFYPPEGKTWEKDCPTRWRNPIFMPKVAARLFLRVTGVRCERLQEVTAEGAYNEGASCFYHGVPLIPSFIIMWNKNKSKDYLWESNPWVWVYELERTKDNE